MLTDRFGARPTVQSRAVHSGMIWTVRRDTVDFADGVRFDREYIDHPGAVAVLAFTDDARAVIIRQYRHPAGGCFAEIPAGLLDKDGEALGDAALRELAEETGYEATRIHHLLDVFPSAGSSSEMIRILVALDAHPAASVEFDRTDEEAEIEVELVPLGELVDAVLGGEVTNAALGSAVLAVWAHLNRQGLGEADVAQLDLPDADRPLPGA